MADSHSEWVVVSEDGRRRPGFLARWLITAFGLWVAAALVPGIQITGTWNIILAALLFGVVNAFIRPIVVLFTLPLSIITLGLFLLVVNGAMLGLVAAMMDSFRIGGLFPAILGSIIITIISWAVSR